MANVAEKLRRSEEQTTNTLTEGSDVTRRGVHGPAGSVPFDFAHEP